MQVGSITVMRTGGYVAVDFDDGAGRFLIRPEEACQLGEALIAIAGATVTTTEGLSL